MNAAVREPRHRPSLLHVSAVEYGARTLLFPQLEHLRRHGYDVRLGCSPDGAEFGADAQRFAPVRLRLPRTPHPGRMARGLIDVQAAVWRHRPDVLHLHSPAAALAVRSLPRPSWPREMRIVYTVHGFAHQWDRLDRPRDRALEIAERLLSRRTDALLFQSKEDLEECERRGYRGRLRYLGNGVEDRWWQVPVARRTERRLRLLFVGRLVAEKGVLDLLDAIERVAEVELTIVGSQIASERDGVEAEARARLLRPVLAGRVAMLGYLDKPALHDVLARHDVLVLPSYREGVPRSILEAIAAGRPVIATRIRGCRELVVDGRNGALVEPGDVGELAAAIRRVARAPAGEFDRWADASRAAAEAYRERAVFDRLLDCYREVGVAPA